MHSRFELDAIELGQRPARDFRTAAYAFGSAVDLVYGALVDANPDTDFARDYYRD